MPKKAAKSASLRAVQAAVRKAAMAHVKRIYRPVRMLRRKRGMSVKELSAKSGVTEYLIRRIESGAMPRVRMDKLFRLGFVLAGSMTEFLIIGFRRGKSPPAPSEWSE